MEISTQDWPFVQVRRRLHFGREENARFIPESGANKVWAFYCSEEGNRPRGQIERSGRESKMAKKTLKKATKMEPKKALTMHLPAKFGK